MCLIGHSNILMLPERIGGPQSDSSAMKCSSFSGASSQTCVATRCKLVATGSGRHAVSLTPGTTKGPFRNSYAVVNGADAHLHIWSEGSLGTFLACRCCYR